jgi:DNA replication protein DnaC
MVNEATITKLHELRLSAMVDAYRNQMEDPVYRDLSFEERFALMVDSEWARRKNNKLRRLIKKSGLYISSASIEDIEYHADRRLDKGQITRLSTCSFIQERHNLMVLGASGAGKTYISCAFGIAACRNFFTVKYVRLPDLINELAVAKGEGVLGKMMKALKRVQLLIIDEWLLIPLTEGESRLLLEIIEARHKKASTVFSSQFAPAGWHGKIGEGPLADAILDRIVHDSYTIMIHGEESMRKKKGIQTIG